MNDFNISGVHRKILFLRAGGVHEKAIYREHYLKRGEGVLRQFADLRGTW